MNGFTKLDANIITSSIWLQDDATLRVWIGLLALADADGFVSGSIPGLANIFRVTVAEVESAIKTFESPDAYSRTKDNDGRRIEPIDGGWLLLNHAKYRARRDPEIRRAQVREAVKRHRSKCNPCNQNVINVSQSKPKQKQKSEADNETDISFKTFWEAYPRKQEKKEAQKAFERLNGIIAFDALLSAVEKQKLPGGILAREKKFIPLPASYLRGERWNDEGDNQAPAPTLTPAQKANLTITVKP